MAKRTATIGFVVFAIKCGIIQYKSNEEVKEDIKKIIQHELEKYEFN